MDCKKIAKRLRFLRKEKGLTYDALSEAIANKYGITISSASLKKYEVMDEFHQNFGKLKGMNIEFLYIFSKFYDVSADYLLGETDSRYLNLTERQISEKIGLSKESVSNLRKLFKMDNKKTVELLGADSRQVPELRYSSIIDFLLANGYFLNNFPDACYRYFNEKSRFSINNKKTTLDDDSSFLVGMTKYAAMHIVEFQIDSYYDRLFKIITGENGDFYNVNKEE